MTVTHSDSLFKKSQIHLLNVFLNTNPLHPNISKNILHTVLYTFPEALTRRICLKIKSFISW